MVQSAKLNTDETVLTQGPEEIYLSLEHEKPSKTSEKMGYFDRVTVSVSFVTHSIDRKPRDWGLARSAYSRKYGLVSFFTRHCVPRSPFGRQPSVTLRATFLAPARIWLAVIDFQNGEQ